MILELHSIFEMGIDVSELLNDIMEFCRIIIMIKLKVDTPEINPDELYYYEEIAPRFSLDDLMYIISSLMNVKTEIKSSTNPYFILEVALIRLSKMDEMQDLATVIRRLESSAITPGVSLPVQNLPSPKTSNVTEITAPKPNSAVKEAAPVIESFDEKSLKQNWERLVNRLRKESSFAALALKNSEIIEVSTGRIVLNPDTPNNYKLLSKNLEILQTTISELFKTRVRVTLNEPKALPIEEVKIVPINQIIEENPILTKLAEITKSTIEPG
jgi:DNA polymerase III gamma/tau subunit